MRDQPELSPEAAPSAELPGHPNRDDDADQMARAKRAARREWLADSAGMLSEAAVQLVEFVAYIAQNF